MAQRSTSSGAGPCSSIGSPITFQSRPSVAAPTGTGDRALRVHAGRAAGQAVGRVHRDCAHPIVAEMLLHLRHERARLVAAR